MLVAGVDDCHVKHVAGDIKHRLGVTDWEGQHFTVTSAQIRAARGFVSWSARRLAEAADVGLSTIERAEAGGSLTNANMDALRRALETAGVEFILENGGGAGVRLRKPAP